MAHLNRKQQTVALKCVYWGPERSGKTANLMQLHSRFPKVRRGRLVKLDVEQGEPHFFEYFPGKLGRIGEYDVRVDYLTAPAQPALVATRRALLREADAVIFVADSAPTRQPHNLDALTELKAVLAGRAHKVAIVFQWNRRDRPRRVAIDALERLLNPEGAPSQTSIASHGQGVWETQILAISPLLKRLRQVLPGVVERLDAGADERFFSLDEASVSRRTPSGRAPRPQARAALDLVGRRHLGESGAIVVDEAAARRAHTLVARGGVVAAAVGDAEGALLATVGPIEAPTMIAAVAMAGRSLRRVLAGLGIGALQRWSFAVDAVGWYIDLPHDRLVLACGPASETPGANLTHIYGPRPSSRSSAARADRRAGGAKRGRLSGLSHIIAVPGVAAAARFDLEGRALEHRGASPFDEATLVSAMGELDGAVELLSSSYDTRADGGLTSLFVTAAEGWLALRRLDAEVVLCLGVDAPNHSMLKVALSVAAGRGSAAPRGGRRTRPATAELARAHGADRVPLPVIRRLLELLRSYLGPAAKPALKRELVTLDATPRTLGFEALPLLVEQLALRIGNPSWRDEFRRDSRQLLS